jgi:HlyD family secretion protein
VFPAVENGIVRFTVALREASHSGLRPSLRADVLVITDRKPRVLRVKRGPFSDNAARQAFVVRGRRALQTPVTFGLSGLDDVEVVSGLSEGDEVIISDMRDYAHLTHVTIR